MESHCLGEKMDLIDLEEETIDAEILDSMAVSQETSRQHKSQWKDEFMNKVVQKFESIEWRTDGRMVQNFFSSC